MGRALSDVIVVGTVSYILYYGVSVLTSGLISASVYFGVKFFCGPLASCQADHRSVYSIDLMTDIKQTKHM